MTVNNLQSETAVSPENDPPYSICLPIPQSLGTLLPDTQFDSEQISALKRFLALPLNAKQVEVLACIEQVLVIFEPALPKEETAVQRAQKFDIYDEFFNVNRAIENTGPVFIHGLLLTYANALKNMSHSRHTMSVIEIPLLRVAVESTLGLFQIGEIE